MPMLSPRFFLPSTLTQFSFTLVVVGVVRVSVFSSFWVVYLLKAKAHSVQWQIQRVEQHTRAFLIYYCCYDALRGVGIVFGEEKEKSVIVSVVVAVISCSFANTHYSVKAQLHWILFFFFFSRSLSPPFFACTLFLCM